MPSSKLLRASPWALLLCLAPSGAKAAAEAAADSARTPPAEARFASPVPPAEPLPRGLLHGALVRPAVILAAGGLLAAWAHDEEAPDAAARALDRGVWEGTSDFGNEYGNGLVIGGGALTVLAVGRLGRHAKTAAIGGDLCESFVLGSAASGLLKYTVDRQRPSGGSHSFPSGHTTVAFCVVPVLEHHLGWRAAAPAALLATATGLGRLEDRRHFLSDVVAGAALGLACGDLVSGPGFLPGHARLLATPGGVGVEIPF